MSTVGVSSTMGRDKEMGVRAQFRPFCNFAMQESMKCLSRSTCHHHVDHVDRDAHHNPSVCQSHGKCRLIPNRRQF